MKMARNKVCNDRCGGRHDGFISNCLQYTPSHEGVLCSVDMYVCIWWIACAVCVTRRESANDLCLRYSRWQFVGRPLSWLRNSELQSIDLSITMSRIRFSFQLIFCSFYGSFFWYSFFSQVFFFSFRSFHSQSVFIRYLLLSIFL